MGIFNNIKSLSDKAIKRADTTFEVLYGDYVKKDELLNYYNKTKPIIATNPIDMGGNKISNLGDPAEDADSINKSFLNKRISYATRNLKTEINTSIAELTKTNNDKVIDLETKITRGATDLSEIQKTITSNIKAITDTLAELNKKDTLTAEEIKNINDKLVNELKSVETKMNDFNKMFIDTEELQSEITKLKNSLINSLTNKDAAETAAIKTDISNVKASIESHIKQIKGFDIKIGDLYTSLKDLKDKGDKTAALETKINDFNTQKTLINEELQREITKVSLILTQSNIIFKSGIEELEKKHTILKQTADLNALTIKVNKDELNKKIIETNTKISDIKLNLSDDIIQMITNLNTEINNLRFFSSKVPFQFIIATLVATDKASLVEIFGTNISTSHDRKDVSYDILSRVPHNENFRTFRSMAVHSKYFERVGNTILIPNVGIRVYQEGTYVIQLKFNIKIKQNRNARYLQVQYKHNEINYPQSYMPIINKELIWMEQIRFDCKANDTLDIKLNAVDVTHEDIFETFMNSSIEIFYIDYLRLPIVKDLIVA